MYCAKVCLFANYRPIFVRPVIKLTFEIFMNIGYHLLLWVGFYPLSHARGKILEEWMKHNAGFTKLVLGWSCGCCCGSVVCTYSESQGHEVFRGKRHNEKNCRFAANTGAPCWTPARLWVPPYPRYALFRVCQLYKDEPAGQFDHSGGKLPYSVLSNPDMSK